VLPALATPGVLLIGFFACGWVSWGRSRPRSPAEPPRRSPTRSRLA